MPAGPGLVQTKRRAGALAWRSASSLRDLGVADALRHSEQGRDARALQAAAGLERANHLGLAFNAAKLALGPDGRRFEREPESGAAARRACGRRPPTLSGRSDRPAAGSLAHDRLPGLLQAPPAEAKLNVGCRRGTDPCRARRVFSPPLDGVNGPVTQAEEAARSATLCSHSEGLRAVVAAACAC